MTFDEVTGTAEEWLEEVARRARRQHPGPSPEPQRNTLVILESNLARIRAKRLDPIHGIRNLYLNKAPK